MHFVGVDLAWGGKRPTGVAVLDAQGRLLEVSAHGSDDAIMAALAPYARGDCVVGIDAPLVVNNPSGNRPCEAELNRDFGRFDAGAHPSNTGKPEFASGPRGARLAELLDLDIDPASHASRRAIEVYPHPATVSLFRLGRTLKYKQKPGRALPELKSEMLRLMRLLEGLADSPVPLQVSQSDDWLRLLVLVESAQRKSDLRRSEDQVDAVVCAYVAMFAERRPGETTTYGDVGSGYIVTPTLPADHRPAPRVAAGSASAAKATDADVDEVKRAVETFAAGQSERREATDRFVDLVVTLLDEAGINYLSVTGRAKSVASFAAKANRTVAGRLFFADPLAEITDQIGVRVITYLHGDVTAVADLLRDQLAILDDRDMGEETAREGRFGYASRHLLVALDPTKSPPSRHEELRGHQAQIQVRTVLQHAWAEFEHAIRYKGTIPKEHVSDLDRRFSLAAGLLELADREFTMIQERLQSTVAEERPAPDDDDPRISTQDLATFLASQYADAGWSRADHYEWVSGLLLELGITSLDELAAKLSSVDGDAINARMGYRYPAGAVRRLDDALLAIFGTRYLGLHGNAHREAALRTRLETLREPVERPDAQ